MTNDKIQAAREALLRFLKDEGEESEVSVDGETWVGIGELLVREREKEHVLPPCIVVETGYVQPAFTRKDGTLTVEGLREGLVTIVNPSNNPEVLREWLEKIEKEIEPYKLRFVKHDWDCDTYEIYTEGK